MSLVPPPSLGNRPFARQLGLLLWLLYDPHTLFPGIQKDNACKKWNIDEVDEAAEIVGGFFCQDYRLFVEGGECSFGTEVRGWRGSTTRLS